MNQEVQGCVLTFGKTLSKLSLDCVEDRLTTHPFWAHKEEGREETTRAEQRSDVETEADDEIA